jgi:hypothetical protein
MWRLTEISGVELESLVLLFKMFSCDKRKWNAKLNMMGLNGTYLADKKRRK